MVVRERSGVVLLATSSFLCGVREWVFYYVERAVALLRFWMAGCRCCVLVLQSTEWANVDVCLCAESFGALGAWCLYSYWELSVHCVAFMVGTRSLQCVGPGVGCRGEALLLVVGGVVHSTYGQHALATLLSARENIRADEPNRLKYSYIPRYYIYIPI